MKRREHIFIPDTQCKKGVKFNHLTAAGNLIVDKKPDVIVMAMDHWDMPSLSSYDRGKKSFEGRRYKEDIEAGHAGMEAFLKPIWEYNAKRKKQKMRPYKPRFVGTLGNHEYRIVRAVESEAILDGTIGIKDLELEKYGMEVYQFLDAVDIDGILYSHFFPRSPNGKIMQNRRGAPTARAQAQREMQSCTSGHLQGLDWAIHQTNNRRVYGLIAGSFYQHEEEYLTPQGTAYWRGCVYKHEVKDGNYDPMFLSLEYLLRDWL